MSVNKFTLLEKGGAWIAAVRNWIQWNAINGDRVHWGAKDTLHLKTNLTDEVLYDICSESVAAAINEEREKYINELTNLINKLKGNYESL